MIYIVMKRNPRDRVDIPRTIVTVEDFVGIIHFDLEHVEAIIVSNEANELHLDTVRHEYPTLCGNTKQEQMFFGDTAKMILCNCFIGTKKL